MLLPFHKNSTYYILVYFTWHEKTFSGVLLLRCTGCGSLTSTMSELVLLSWGSLYSVYFSNTLSMSVLAYWNSLLELLKMMRAISQSHSTLSSYAFFIKPNFLFVKVTWRSRGRDEERRQWKQANTTTNAAPCQEQRTLSCDILKGLVNRRLAFSK